MTRLERFHKYLTELIGHPIEAEGCAFRLKNAPFMDLSVESWPDLWPDLESGRWYVSLCHYGEQNGDAMRDPEIVFLVEAGRARPIYFRNDYAHVENEVPEGHRSPSLESFCDIWFRNLREQGFFEAAKVRQGESHERI